MKYIYSPDSYNETLIENKFESYDEFLDLQLKYRSGFERILNCLANFKSIDDLINRQSFTIPKISDKDYNFYHKFSTLDSDYVFLRNNFHIENLSVEDIEQLKKMENVNMEFLNKTLYRVIFEDGEQSCYGIPKKENFVDSKSIVFEFAYDQKKCDSVPQLNQIKNFEKSVFNYLDKCFENKINIPISILSYNAITDIYYQENPNIVFK